MLLCLLFPLLFMLVKKYGNGFVLVMTLAITVVLTMMRQTGTPLFWWYSCFVGRLPVILGGMILFHNPQFLIRRSFIIACGALGLVSLLVSDKFLATAYLCVPLIYVLAVAWEKQILNKKIKYYLEFIGKHSLEFYLGNCFALTICQHIVNSYGLGRLSTLAMALMSLAVTLLVGYIFVRINRSVQHAIS